MQIARFVIPMLLVVATVGPSMAETTESPIAAGTLEFFPSVAFNRTTSSMPGGTASGSVTHMNFSAGVGHCFSDDFELAGSLLFQHKAVAGTGRNGFGGSAGGVFNFTPQGSVIPFVSGSVGLLSYSSDGQSDKAWLFPMIRAGFRTVMGADRTVNVSIGFHHEINPESAFEESSNVFDVGVGLSIFRPRAN